MGSVSKTKKKPKRKSKALFKTKPNGSAKKPKKAVKKTVVRSSWFDFEPLAYDVETTGLDLHRGHRIFAWATADKNGSTGVHRIKDDAVSKRELARLFKGQWAFNAHHAKFDMTASENFLDEFMDQGPGKRPVFHCTRILSHILQNHHHDHSLDSLAWELAGYERIDAKVKKMAAECGGFDKIPIHLMMKYQRLDVERGMCLFLFFWKKVRANPAWLDCYQTEMDLIWTTMRMERRGLMIHRRRTEEMVSELEAQSEEAKEEIFRIVGRRFNPGSHPQLRKVLYKDLGFPIISRTGITREPALDKDTLIELQRRSDHPIFGPILQMNAYHKGSKDVQKYLDLAGSDDILHPTINTCQAITARQSCENPNLQNVSKSIADAKNPYPVRARRAFRPRPGYVWIPVDYAGIEMRLLVHYSQEPEMIRCMMHGDGDIHSLVAEAFYQEKYTQAVGDPRKAMRGRAKNGGFGLAYGAAPPTLGSTIGVSPQAAKEAYARFKARFPSLAGLMRSVIKEVHENGYVESVFGRRYHIPAGKAYAGLNYLIQGTAGEMLKRAENRLDDYNRSATGDEVKLLLPIHDEIIIEYPRSRMPELGGYLKDIRALMIDFGGRFSVPMEVEASIATSSWEVKKDLAIPA